MDWIRRPSGKVTPISVDKEEKGEVCRTHKWQGSPTFGKKSITENERKDNWMFTGEKAAMRDFEDTTLVEEDAVKT